MKARAFLVPLLWLGVFALWADPALCAKRGKPKKVYTLASEMKTPVSACVGLITELARKSQGGDWLVQDELFKLMDEEGIRDLLFGRCTQCPTCELYNPHWGGSFTLCRSCEKPYDGSTLHNVLNKQRKELIHVRSIAYDDDGIKKTFDVPWKCAFCGHLTMDTLEGKPSTHCSNSQCEKPRLESERVALQVGEDRILVDAPNVMSGETLETPEEAERIFAARERPPDPEPETEAPTAEEVFEKHTQPNARARGGLTRTQLWGVGLASAIGVGTIYYGMQDPPLPQLPKYSTVAAVVNDTYWEIEVIVKKNDGKGRFLPFKTFKAVKKGPEHKPDFPPGIPPEYFTDTKTYQWTKKDYYSLMIRSTGRPNVEWEISEEEYANWRAEDKTEMRVTEDGTPLLLRRLR